MLRVVPNTHLAGTVKAGSQRRERHDHGPAAVAFDSIVRSDARQRPHPAQVFLQHISQVTDVECVPVILCVWRGGESRGRQDLTKTFSRIELSDTLQTLNTIGVIYFKRQLFTPP